MYKIAALYKFIKIEDPMLTQEVLTSACNQHEIRGTLILAHEGINGTIAGTPTQLDTFLAYLQSDPRFQVLELKFSWTEKRPFSRIKVRVKKEIVTLGQEGVNPTELSGEYVKPENWNQLLSDPEVVLIDTRNNYEVNIGTFKGAINPNTESFREFPDFVKQHLNPKVHKKVAMFCTGGIRCEKSTALLKKEGFEAVYHLEGGILKYLEVIDEKDSLWSGECFVFDERTAVSHGLKDSNYVFCRGCRNPLSPEDTKHAHYLLGIHCHHCYPTLTEKKLRASTERQHQINLARAKAAKTGNKVHANHS